MELNSTKQKDKPVPVFGTNSAFGYSVWHHHKYHGVNFQEQGGRSGGVVDPKECHNHKIP